MSFSAFLCLSFLIHGEGEAGPPPSPGLLRRGSPPTTHRVLMALPWEPPALKACLGVLQLLGVLPRNPLAKQLLFSKFRILLGASKLNWFYLK